MIHVSHVADTLQSLILVSHVSDTLQPLILVSHVADALQPLILASHVADTLQPLILASHVAEMIIGSTFDMDPSQQIYAKLFQFDYLQAETTSGTTITPLLSQNSSVVIFQKSNAILITDALINLQRIEKLVREMDKPQAVREEIKFIKLNFVQATEMQQRIGIAMPHGLPVGGRFSDNLVDHRPSVRW